VNSVEKPLAIMTELRKANIINNHFLPPHLTLTRADLITA
jgi:hypothetical protein